MQDISNAPVESWDIDLLKPYERNNKKHPPHQIKALAASIADQGLNDPITVDKDGVIISGHGRLEAVKSLGWKKVPVRCLRDLTEAQAAKLRIAANKTTSTEYDVDVLQQELERLNAIGEIDLSNIGLDDRELEMLMTDIGEMDDDLAVDDIEGAVEDFENEVSEEAEKAEGEDLPIWKVFNIKRLPLKAKRLGTVFMARIEESTGLKGEAALLAHMESVAND